MSWSLFGISALLDLSSRDGHQQLHRLLAEIDTLAMADAAPADVGSRADLLTDLVVNATPVTETLLVTPRPGQTVVDLAAGTGKLTRRLIPTGAHVIAVEPGTVVPGGGSAIAGSDTSRHSRLT